MQNRFIDKALVGIPKNSKLYKSMYNAVSPIPNKSVSFNWLNTDFPYWHTHNHWEIYVITYGSYMHYIDGKKYIMNAGDACIIRPSDTHKIVNMPNNKGHHIAFLFTEEYATKLFSCYEKSIIEPITETKQVMHFHAKNFPLANIIDFTLSLTSGQITKEEKTFKTEIIINSLIQDYFLQKFATNIGTFPKWFTDFLLVLNDPGLKISVKQLAKKHTPYSYSRLSRIFKEYMETTIVDYIKEIKFQHACNLLTNSNFNILEISYELAYDSISYFNKMFKERAGVTPTEYRKAHKSF